MSEHPPQPAFPVTHIQINQQGMIITTALGPGLSINQALDENTMNEIFKRWLETRKEVQRSKDIIRDLHSKRKQGGNHAHGI